jgi:16S rRNA (adenine1518-N6/adenine1519-N6)-dimethyltransferase
MGTLRPKKNLGQHFLVNTSAIKTICDAALASPALAILEIGPGQGALTQYLLEDDRPLWGIELDIDACKELSLRYANIPNFHLLQGDALDVDFPNADSLSIVGNLPYNKATAILTRLLLEPIPWERMTLMFQMEVGQKLVGKPGERSYGPLSVLAQSVARLTTLIKLGPSCFSPRPRVDSIVLTFDPKPDAPNCDERKSLLSMLHRSFTHRRKTLANNWSSFMSSRQIDAMCNATGISPGCRAEAIPVETWLALASAATLGCNFM